jgi:hypothetical protein
MSTQTPLGTMSEAEPEARYVVAPGRERSILFGDARDIVQWLACVDPAVAADAIHNLHIRSRALDGIVAIARHCTDPDTTLNDLQQLARGIADVATTLER